MRRLTLVYALVAGLGNAGTVLGQARVAEPTLETAPVPGEGDAADDPAVWVHPGQPELSLIIGTDKKGGLAVYELDGTQRQYIAGVRPNNVDVRYGFGLGGRSIDLVAFSDRMDRTIKIFTVDVASRDLREAGKIAVGANEALGLCLYRSSSSGVYYAFVSDKNGRIEQWRLLDDGGGVGARLVRHFELGSSTEGMVADDEARRLYCGVEELGIWRYGAEPDDGETRVLVDSAGGSGHLTADVEGLAIYCARDGQGYLIASSQGSDEFAVYERGGGNAWLMTFRIGPGKGIDEVTGTDGIDVISASLGPSFAQGAFIAQDDENPGAHQNFKLVPWQAIATAGPRPLLIDTVWNPRIVNRTGG